MTCIAVHVYFTGYFSQYETQLRQVLIDQATKSERRITNMVSTAVGHCRRDILWHWLLIGVTTEEEKARRKGKPDSDDPAGKEGVIRFFNLL